MSAYVTIHGNIGKDPELKWSEKASSVCTVSVGVRIWNSKEKKADTNWYRVTTFGKTAERIANQAHKGMKVLASGELKASAWQGNQGPAVSLDLVAHSFEFLEQPSSDRQQTAPAATNGFTESPEDFPF